MAARAMILRLLCWALCVCVFEAFHFHSHEGKPSSTALRITPDRSQFFTYDALNLTCTARPQGGNWTVKRTTAQETNGSCARVWDSPSGHVCVIEKLYPSDSGQYWCESQLGERSAIVNITVTDVPTFLEYEVIDEDYRSEEDDVAKKDKPRRPVTNASALLHVAFMYMITVALCACMIIVATLLCKAHSATESKIDLYSSEVGLAPLLYDV